LVLEVPLIWIYNNSMLNMKNDADIMPLLMVLLTLIVIGGCAIIAICLEALLF
jgi:hypothetical protein